MGEVQLADALVQVLARIEEERDAILGLLRQMIRLQPEGEDSIQAFAAERMRGAGANVEQVTYRPMDVPMVAEFAATPNQASEPRRSIVGRFPPGAAGGRSVILFAHPDGEEIAGTGQWTRPPFEGVIEDGRIYGWGVADDLAGVAIMVAAMEAIHRCGVRLAGEVLIASTPSKRHARGVAALLHQGYEADASIYMHPAESGAGMQEIKALASGQLEFTVTVTGRKPPTTEPGHTAFAHLGVNPLDKLRIVTDALHRLDEERAARIHHPLLDGAVGRSTNILISYVNCGQNRAFSRMPIEAVMGAAVSFPPGIPIGEVQQEVTRAIGDAAAADPWLAENPPAIRWVSGVTGAEVSDTHPLYRAVAAAIGDVCGVAPHVNALHTSSDIRHPMVQKGIPTVGLGPLCGNLTQTGRHDEWVDAEDYLRAVKVTAASIIRWCGTAPMP